MGLEGGSLTDTLLSLDLLTVVQVFGFTEGLRSDARLRQIHRCGQTCEEPTCWPWPLLWGGGMQRPRQTGPDLTTLGRAQVPQMTLLRGDH